ncbi:MAG: FtsW/RodA/SpoVE family cell cycle protein [Victivallaceae bacterium]|nr:FtsW/RodA/SpoVE family cell cycle protein [Victivallaceae bacterium]
MNADRSPFLPENTLSIAIFLLALCGVLTIVSGGSAANFPMEPSMLQILHLLIALMLFFAARKMPFNWFESRGIWIFGAFFWFFLALLGVFGTRINGMCGWYRCGFLSLQPAEIGKGVYLAALCAALTHRKRSRRLPAALAVAALWAIPILRQPDFTTAMIYLVMFAMLAFLAGCSLKFALAFVSVAAATAGIFIWSTPYAWRRIAGFFSPEIGDANWHVLQFELTVSRGGWFGSRLGGAVWSNAYLPLAYNDSAYATLAETLGFCGTLAVWALFVIVIVLMLKLARKPMMSDFARLYVEGAALWIAFQGLLHVSVNLTMIPPTGLTLPFISYGGSSLVGFFLLSGWALAAAKPCGAPPLFKEE